MRILKTIDALREYQASIHACSLGFVPTMGSLHVGHAELLMRSIQENTATLLSIFVNPTQFDEVSDFEHYPRDLKDDLSLANALGVNAVFLPSVEIMYPEPYFKVTCEHPFSHIMEGKERPSHFDGVCTIVLKLLNLIKPDKAYFGEKDYQQYAIVRDLAMDFFLRSEIILCPTTRQASGMPFSSRLQRLSEENKALAAQFFEILHQHITSPLDLLKATLENTGIDVEYLEDHQQRRFIAACIGDVRLIDNIELG